MRNWYLAPLAAGVLLPISMTEASGQTALPVVARAAQNDISNLMIRNFNFKAEASKVLTALAHLAHVGIVTTTDLNTVIDAKLNDIPIEDAVKLVAAQAKAAYRHVGNVFIVAPDKDMPDILAKYGTEERVPLQNLYDATVIKDAADQIRAAVPFVTARPAGKSIILIGAMEDLEKARAILQELDAPVTGEPIESVSLTLNTLPSQDVEAILKSQFQKLTAQKVGDNVVVFSGKRSEVLKAQAFFKDLDRGKETNVRYSVYQVKYASPTSLVTTLRQTIQNLTVVSGPASYYVPLANLSFSQSNALGGGGSGSGSNGSSGGSSGGGLGGSSGSGSSGGGGSSTGGSTGGNGSSGGNNVNGGERTRSIILGGTEEIVKAALKLLDSLDVPTPQIVLDVKVVSTSPTSSQTLGLDWSTGPGAASKTLSINGLGSFATLPTTATATLNAFFTRQDVHVLAKPSITALDNHDGVVFVGQTRRVSVSTIPTNVGAGNSIVLNNIVEIPVGIILQMRPRVNEGDIITLHVHPIYSTAGAVNPTTGLFDTFQREADTTVRVRSGETLVIGGLLQEEDTKTLIKIPVLGDIPLLGQFFRNYSKQHLRTEVLVFITPHLLPQ